MKKSSNVDFQVFITLDSFIMFVEIYCALKELI